jgi:galactose mutarotase-like enzyme
MSIRKRNSSRASADNASGFSYQKVLGYSPDELQSSPFLEQVHPDDRELVTQAASDARTTGVGKTLEYRFRHKNGSWLVLESTSSVIHNATPFDFRKLTVIGSRINQDDEQLKNAKGYDDNWVLDKLAGQFAEAAEVYDPSSGRILAVWTTQPGLQFYTGNFLDGSIRGKDGKVYGHRAALCLETQHFTDSPNQSSFPTTELKPGQKYHHVTEFRFSAR